MSVIIRKRIKRYINLSTGTKHWSRKRAYLADRYGDVRTEVWSSIRQCWMS